MADANPNVPEDAGNAKLARALDDYGTACDGAQALIIELALVGLPLEAIQASMGNANLLARRLLAERYGIDHKDLQAAIEANAERWADDTELQNLLRIRNEVIAGAEEQQAADE